MVERVRKGLFWALVLSETSHVFCCVLPTLFTALGFLAGLGMITIPAFLMRFHDSLHAWEVPMMVVSGLILGLGWILHLYSLRIDCHDTGCAHPPCSPSKRRSAVVMKIATVLFIANILIYGLVHRNLGSFEEAGHALETTEADHHGHAH